MADLIQLEQNQNDNIVGFEQPNVILRLYSSISQFMRKILTPVMESVSNISV